MSAEYEDTYLIECNRESAITKQDDNAGMWINELNNTVQLQAGDQVSIYSSFINQLGSGQTAPIEFRGKKLKKNKTITYTKNVPLDFYISNDKKTFTIYESCDNHNETIELQDNKASTVINYYKTMDALSYVQLPRRFIPDTKEFATHGDERTRWAITDSVTYGRVNAERNEVANPVNLDLSDGDVYGYVVDDLQSFRYYGQKVVAPSPEQREGHIQLWNLKNDNSRFTIMKRTKNIFPNQPNLSDTGFDSVAINTSFYPPYYARDPEFFDYIVYREKLDLEVNTGFSSAKSIADSITRQLRKTESNETSVLKDRLIATDQAKINQPLSKELTSQTYKTFNCATEYNLDDTFYAYAADNGTDPTTPDNGNTALQDDGLGFKKVTDVTNRLSATYYSSYEYIACKRPEIYETGSIANDIFGIKLKRNRPLTQNATHGLVLNLPYFNEAAIVAGVRLPSVHLTRLKNFIDAQGLYPELFSAENVKNLLAEAHNPYWDHSGLNPTGDSFITEDNARYFHINNHVALESGGAGALSQLGINVNSNIVHTDVNRFQSNTNPVSPLPDFTQLGNSNYNFIGTTKDNVAGTSATFNRNLAQSTKTEPFYFYYDPTQKDTFYEYPSQNTSSKTGSLLSYGCFGVESDSSGAIENHIVIYPNFLEDNTGTAIGIPETYLHGTAGAKTLTADQKVGFDRHWNAWGNSCIVLSSGVPQASYPLTQREDLTAGQEGKAGTPHVSVEQGTQGSGIFDPELLASNIPPIPSTQLVNLQYNNKLYCGANEPELGFDGSNFFFKSLHTPLNEGNLNPVENRDGSGHFTNPSASRIVYKMNPEQQYINYTPTQFPYMVQFRNYLSGSSIARTTTRSNPNLTPFSIHDTTTGIIFEDLGFTEDSWDNSLWNRLGFTYSQFNGSSSRNTRITQTNTSSLKYITTNANIDAVDTKSWMVNGWGEPTYTGQLLNPFNVGTSAFDVASIGTNNPTSKTQLPNVTLPTDSITIPAQNYPISMTQGYYNVRADIVPVSSFVGHSGDTSLPIMGVIDKQNPVGDYYISNEQDIIFTITKPTLISSIKVAITDPDGNFAPISERSSVIFKVSRTRTLNKNIGRDLLARYGNPSM